MLTKTVNERIEMPGESVTVRKVYYFAQKQEKRALGLFRSDSCGPK